MLPEACAGPIETALPVAAIFAMSGGAATPYIGACASEPATAVAVAPCIPTCCASEPTAPVAAIPCIPGEAALRAVLPTPSVSVRLPVGSVGEVGHRAPGLSRPHRRSRLTSRYLGLAVSLLGTTRRRLTSRRCYARLCLGLLAAALRAPFRSFFRSATRLSYARPFRRLAAGAAAALQPLLLPCRDDLLTGGGGQCSASNAKP